MDKHDKEIKVKINGKEQSFMMEKSTSLPLPEAEVSATKEEFSISPIVSFSGENSKPKRAAWGRFTHGRAKSAILAILLAVIVGTSFGLVVLYAIPKPKETASVDDNGSAISLEQTQSQEKTAPSSTEPTSTSSASLTVSVIQAGVFSDEKAAKAYAQKLQSSNLPAVLIGKNPTSVFIGVGKDKPSLSLLNDLYKQKGADTYIKSMSVQRVKHSSWQSFYQELATLSVQLLEKKEASDGQWESLQKKYKQLQASDASSDQVWKSIENAYLSLIAYREKKDDALLWKTQQQLLDLLK
ncbi:hypothetical protein PNH38_02805 [Anoxybacillus rupiensis]|uniref:SPOR domain-containing protein n=1 Tax=Anoxybacteroides rupiense TaxID=311460 RepID=A0ABT5W2Q4_9BACL|nr:hypothetical protein [Anoxybacillus rupiensis]MDE8562810.1 hypothetical protein [Anoxybacillus rupiensis]